MPRDSNLTTTKIDQEHFGQILPFFRGEGKMGSVRDAIKRVIDIGKLNIININGQNLLVVAMIAKAEEVIEVLKLYVTEVEIGEAELISARHVDRNVEYIPIEEARSIDQVAAVAQPRSIDDIIKEQNIEELERFFAQSMLEIDFVDPKNNYTPIEKAAFNNWLEGIRWLVEKGAKQQNLLSGAVWLGANKPIIDYIVEELKLCSREECVIKVVREPKYINAIGPIIATLSNGVNVRLSVTGTALHEATDAENIEGIAALITEHNAEIEAKNDNKDTALQYAVRTGKLKTIEPLITNHANVNVLTECGETLLHIVVDSAMTSTLMKLDAAAEMIQTIDRSGNMPTHRAVLGGKKEVLDIMLKECPIGIDKEALLSCKGADQKNIFEMIPEGNDGTMRYMLIEHGAKEEPHDDVASEVEVLSSTPIEPEVEQNRPTTPPMSHTQSTPSTPKGKIGSTPFSSPKTPVAPKTPIKPEDIKTPVVNIPPHITPLNALIMAIDAENIQEISNILEKHRDLDLLNTKIEMDETGSIIQSSTPNKQGKINLMQFAVYQGKFEVLKTLQKFWIHPELEKLIQAINGNKYEAVEGLLKQYPILLKTKLMVQTLEHQIGMPEIEILRTSKGSICIQFVERANNMNLLHLAAYLNKHEAAVALVNNGFSGRGDEQDSAQGYTAMHYAVENADENMISILPKFNTVENADENITSLLQKPNLKFSALSSRDGETPAELAAFLGKEKIFVHILELSEEKITYIHLLKAIKGKNGKMVKEMIEKNPTFLLMNNKETGMNVLMEVAQTSNTALFHSLFDRVFQKSIKQVLGNVDYNHKNILHYIAEYGDAAMAQVLKTNEPEYFNILVALKNKFQKLPVEVAAESQDYSRFSNLYNILSHKEEAIVKKGFLGIGIKTEIKRVSVLSKDDQKLTNTTFYQKYHKAMDILDTQSIDLPIQAHADHAVEEAGASTHHDD